jgi:hypothetical protein
MNEEEPRFSVMLTRAEVESLIWTLQESPTLFPLLFPVIERLERRLRQRDTYEAQERRLAADPNPVNPSGI